MKKNENIFILFGLVLMLTLASCGGSDTGDDDDDDDNGDTNTLLQISSDDVQEGVAIPIEFACTLVEDDQGNVGMNETPTITWNVPEGTETFGLAYIDIDFNDTVHGLIFNIPNSVTSTDDIGGGVDISPNYLGILGVDGPCPPDGETHDYEVTIYALNKELDVDSTDTDAVLAALSDSDNLIDSDSITSPFTGNDID